MDPVRRISQSHANAVGGDPPGNRRTPEKGGVRFGEDERNFCYRGIRRGLVPGFYGTSCKCLGRMVGATQTERDENGTAKNVHGPIGP